VASDRRVAVAVCERADYGASATPIPAPELPTAQASSIPAIAVRKLLEDLDLDAERRGTSQWNPLASLIQPGARVLLKPNWVLHQNRSGGNMDCLVTHTAMIEAILPYVVLAQPASIVIGDAPIQGCDFEALARACDHAGLLARFAGCGIPISIRDFRRTRLAACEPGSERSENCREIEQYVLFDLGSQSLLEELSDDGPDFRVTMYDPRLLSQRHSAGRHQYLIAREAIDADLVINLPKLKTHKKSGVTGTLKNLVGINGNKEFLPHHRKGGSAQGGDSYEGSSWLKHIAENLTDSAYQGPSGPRQALLAKSARWLVRGATAVLGGDDNFDGSWYGNDTVWRMSLDLQRILAYGNLEGKLEAEKRRKVLNITDAIIGGEGDGPLSPTPVSSGFVTASLNSAAAEWVHARLMGFDPERIPIVHHAFDRFPHPLAEFEPESIEVLVNSRATSIECLGPFHDRCFQPSAGWAGRIERQLSPSMTRSDGSSGREILARP
jgi:uncharacterized protein (DUF362 family)